VTSAENTARTIWPMSQRTHCKHGHPLEGSNMYWQGRRRVCRACRNMRFRAWRERHKKEVSL
jgi:hypothetical protein